AGNGTGQVMLDEGDVLEVFTVSGGGVPDASDLTGTIIQADKPVSVFGGHKCTQIPVGTQACDRLEEAMLPIETLSKKYIITPPLIPTGGNTPKPQMVRVIATEDATALMYDPPQNGAPAMLAKAGDYAEIAKTGADFEIASDKKIMVAQYMQGQGAGGNSGDPAMALAVATDQYRSSYLIHAPTNYESNYVNITAPMGATVNLDGMAVGGFVAIGNTGYGVARVKLNNNGDGNHTFDGNQPFGVSIYGYGQYTSYWYPGGLDLEILPQ
ncbi:MAG: IgGFc-binding protein, partial [Myxococcales bacterium]|nr:IgGFc-binding protein [Myxococcales bacterium]